MQHDNNRRTKRMTAGLMASAIAVSAFAVSPSATNVFSLTPANAEAVRVEAPKAPSFADVVEAVSPAVVSVRVEQDIHPASDQGDFRFDRRFFGENLPELFKDHPDFFKRFFGEGPRDKKRGPRRFGSSQGSGFFISEDGYLVTNNHVIEGGSKFIVVMDDGTELNAKLIGADKRSDLAVLKVEEARKFTYVSFSETDPRIGDWVVAVGNPFGLGGTVTAGIVSANGRQIGANRYDDFIQIDAAVNKGNSGGPAFDLNGEVIGVNTAIFSPSGGNVGIAFAIPASTSEEIVNELIANGKVVRGWLGVQIQPVTEDIAEALDLDEAAGAMVTEPQTDSPADAAGIKSGDIIVAVEGEKIKDPRALARKIAGYAPESEISVTLYRDGKTEELSVTLGTLERMASLESDADEDTAADTTLGLALAPSEDGEGVLVTEVEKGSSADEKGVRPGDIVTRVNGEKVTKPGDVAARVRDVEEEGRKSTLFQIRRDGNSRFIAIPFERG